jgi:DNA replication protein DnaC
MTIKLKENSKPNISKICFECDNELHKKLNEFELSKDFLNRSNTTVFIGRQGSGKTSLLINFVKVLYKKSLPLRVLRHAPQFKKIIKK